MKHRARLVLFFVFTVFVCWGCSSFQLPTDPSSPSISILEPALVPRAVISVADVIVETNNQRKANGLSPLVENLKLNAAADFKMRDMFARQYFDHYAPDQTSGVPFLLMRFGYSYVAAGENLAFGDFRTAGELVAAWMASLGHRANILNSIYRDIGIGIGYDVFMGRKTIVAVQIFGTSSR